MRGKSHLIQGAALGFVATQLGDFNEINTVVFISSCIFGSLLPDLDIETSTIGRELPPVSRIVNRCFGHREVWHTPFVGFLIFTALFFLTKIFGMTIILPGLVGFFLGWLGHLHLDSYTASGIMWLYPFTKKRFHVFPIKSGSSWEYPALFLNIILSVYSLFLIY